VDLVRSLSGDASILRLKECAKCTRLNALGALWKV
jgi:hypothetical protein